MPSPLKKIGAAIFIVASVGFVGFILTRQWTSLEYFVVALPLCGIPMTTVLIITREEKPKNFGEVVLLLFGCGLATVLVLGMAISCIGLPFVIFEGLFD